jgi:hypothetical protein
VNALLLNEFLKEHRKVQEQHRKIQQEEATITELRWRASELQTVLWRRAQIITAWQAPKHAKGQKTEEPIISGHSWFPSSSIS